MAPGGDSPAVGPTSPDVGSQGEPNQPKPPQFRAHHRNHNHDTPGMASICTTSRVRTSTLGHCRACIRLLSATHSTAFPSSTPGVSSAVSHSMESLQ